MKKTTKHLFGKSILVLFALFLSSLSFGQCVNSTSYLTPVSNNSGTVQEIGTCTYSTEYNTISGLIVGENYIFTAETNIFGETPSPRYVSITNGSNVSIAHGMSPLVVNGITATTVRLHVSNDASCAGGSICHRTTVQFLADCPAPINLGANGFTTSGANVTWSPVGTETAWDIQYGVTGFTLGSGTIVTDVTASNYALTSLASGTVYQFYVRANCASEDSLWAGPFSFATVCLPVTEFYESFDTTTASFGGPLPICWSKGGSAANVYLTGGSAIPMSAPNRLYMFSNSDSSIETFANMPLISNLQANTHRLRFTAYCTVADRVIQVGYLTDPNDVATYQYLDEFLMPSNQIGSAAQFTLAPGALPSGVQRLVFRNVTAPGETATIYIDDVRWEAIPTCTEPTNVAVSNVLGTSASVEWVAPASAPAAGYEYYLSTTNTAPTGATVATGSVAAGVTTLSLTSLTPVTNYYIWVRSVCSPTSKSVWTLTSAFTTPCASYVPYYIENFTTFTPACWSKFNDGDVSTGPTGAANSGSWFGRNYLNAPGNNAAVINLYSNFPKGWLVSPLFDLTAGGYQVRYNVGATQYFSTSPINAPGVMGADDFVYFVMSTDGGTTWTTLQTYSATNTPPSAGTTAVFNIPTVNTNSVKFAFYGTSGSVVDGPDYDFFVDNFTVLTIPTCVEPTAVTLSNVLATSATVSWTAPTSAPANGYEYYLSTSSTAPTGATVATGSVAAGVTTVSLTTLTPVTQYYVWVRSVCSTTSTSIWVASASFTTPCSSFVPYYLQNFSTFTFSVQPDCWKRYANGDLTTGPTGADNSGSWTPANMMNVTGNNAAKINLYGTFARGWMVSPVFDLSAGGYQVKFDVGTTDYFGTGPIEAPGVMGSDDAVTFLMSTDGGTTWTTLEAYNTANTPGNSIATETYNIPLNTSATVKFAYYATAGTISDGPDYDFFIDNFIIQTIPLIPPVCATNVTATIAPGCGNFPTAISWTAAAESDGYKLTIGTTSGGNNILNNQVVSATSYPFSGTVNTTYYYKVVPFNNNGDAVGCVEQSFTTAATGCYCPAVPTSNDGLGITNVTLQTTPFPTTDVTYFDHTATVVNTNQNASTNVSIQFATGYDYNTYIWIDFNDNFTFEASELVYTGVSPAPNPSTLDASFTMPLTAALGVHTMRIGSADVLPAPNPCYSGSYGVFLDFKVNVQPELSTDSFDSANFSAYPNPVKDVLNISYNDTISDVSVFNLLGQLVMSVKPSANEYQLNMSQLTVGTYLVKVTSDNQVKTVKVIKN